MSNDVEQLPAGPWPAPDHPVAWAAPRVQAAPGGALALQARAALVGAISAAAIGGGLGWLTALTMANDCSPHDGWCELGAVLIGALIGVVAAAIAYVVAGVVTIHRRRPPGSRAAAIVIHLAWPLVALALLAALNGLAAM